LKCAINIINCIASPQIDLLNPPMLWRAKKRGNKAFTKTERKKLSD